MALGNIGENARGRSRVVGGCEPEVGGLYPPQDLDARRMLASGKLSLKRSRLPWVPLVRREALRAVRAVSRRFAN